MKNRLGTAVAAWGLLLLLAGCGDSKKEPTPAPTVPHDGWMLQEWNGSTALAGCVYLELKDGGVFNLYESFDVPGYVHYSGTYRAEVDPSSEGLILSGSYADGTPWADRYRVEEWTEEVLRLRAWSEDVVSVYVGVVIPYSVRDGVVGGDSRAAGPGRRFL